MMVNQYLISKPCLQLNLKYLNDPGLVEDYNSNTAVTIQIVESNFECTIHFYEPQNDDKE